MKKVKYFSILVLLFSVMTFGCSEDPIEPLNSGDDEEEEVVDVDRP